MQLYLLRHGIAEDQKAGRPDSERALTSEGREKLRRVLKRARSADCVPALILSSPYRRALETSAVAAEVLAYEHEIVTTCGARAGGFARRRVAGNPAAVG